MPKHSAFACPECGKMTLRVVRTIRVGEAKRIRLYVCAVAGCPGFLDTTETAVPRVCADVHQKRGQPAAPQW